jgi:DNA-binding NtrC family response regulator
MAAGGTIFLDEIGTITPSAQIKLLQVLQDGVYSRVGGDLPLKADARIIAATNADIAELVKTGQFRKDLYYRLNVFPIAIPPLQERLEDLQGLTEVFLKNLNIKYGKQITGVHPLVMDRFKRYDWPGNIRELENLLERACILEQTTVLMPQSFPLETMPDMDDSGPGSDPDTPISRARQHAIDRFEQEYLTTLLGQTRGRIDQAAEIAGITPRQLNRLLKRHRLNKNTFKPPRDT